MTKISCSSCKNKTNIEILDAGQFNLYLCNNCKNGFVYPIPKSLSKYYPKIYWQHPGKFSKIRNWLHNSLQKDRVSWFRKYLSSGTVLDVGSGEGSFGKFLGEGFRVTNLEAPFAQVDNKKVIKANFLSWKPKQKFNGIVFLESLEHVQNPQAYLKKASILLKKGGYIFVEYPRFSSLESRIFGKYWLNRDIPRHLVHFTEVGLRAIARKVSLEVVSQKGIMSYQYSPYCLVASMMNVLGMKTLNLRLGLLYNTPVLIFLTLMAPLSFLLETIFFYLGQSPVGLIVLRKD